MEDFYNAFYGTAEHSPAHHAFCERVFGIDLCQHGFADIRQLELLRQVTAIGPAHRVLDLGCGSGLISEYLSDCTGSHITGLDYIPKAIRLAKERTAMKAHRMAFMVGDINRLDLPVAAFDCILSIDTMYFSEDYSATLCALKHSLRPGGQMAFFFSHGREPWVPKEQFRMETILPEKTPLAEALRANGLTFRTWDLTDIDYELAQRRKTVLADLKTQFEAEDALFIYENRLGDANGISQAIEDGQHARYLYLVKTA